MNPAVGAARRNVGSGRQSICFVTETRRTERPVLDPSVRYRCHHRAEALADEGHVCTILSASEFFVRPDLCHDVYIFHRPNACRPGLAKTIETLRDAGKPVVADYDDLIFGEEDVALISSSVRNATMTAEHAIAAFRSNLEALRMFGAVSCSTEPLAEEVRMAHPGARIQVVPNTLPRSVLEFHDRVGSWALPRSSVTIGYFAGTRSHDRDIAEISDVLHRVLCENPSFTLLMVGPVDVPRNLAALPNVFVRDVVGYPRLPAIMATCAVSIAPLERSRFNECKSRVKFLEAALSGCRLIATAIPDMAAIGPDHIDLVETPDDWYEALGRVLDAGARLERARRNRALLEQAAAAPSLRLEVDAA